MESQNHKEQKQGKITAFRQWVKVFNDPTVLILIGFLFIGATVMVWHVARLQSDLMETMALANAGLYTQAIAEFRTLYTKDVVERVRGQGIHVTHDLEKDQKAIPLPATLSMKLGQTIGAHRKGAETRLYSAYPFPWRKEQGGLQDDFGRKAWGFLTQNPQRPFFRFEQFKGRPSIRYATADLMRASCVDCHNQHPDSPKNDWNENDVRGVLEIIHPLDTVVSAAKSGTGETFGLMAVLGLLSFGGLALVINKVRRSSWILEQRVEERTEELWKSNLELKKEIQERWQAEAELAKVSRQHNLILNSAGEGIHGLDLEGKTTFVNPAGAKMLGYEVEELLGVPIHATIHHTKPDRSLYPQERCPMYAAFKDGTVHHVDDEVLWRKDGTSFPVEYSSTPIWEDGQLVGAVVTFKDITERKRAEAKFRLVIEAAPSGMLMIDHQGSIILANRLLTQQFGYGQEELLGQPIEVLVPARFRDQHPAHRTAFFQTSTPRQMGSGRDLYGLRKDGSEFPVEIGLNPVTTDEGTFVLASIIDMTERKRAEAKFRLVIEAAPSGMLMIDHQGSIILANRLLTQQFGYGQEELLGQPIEVLVPARFRDQHPAHRTAFFQTSTPRQMGSGRDLYGLRKDGSEFPVEIGLNPVTTDEGTFVLASIIDMTERKRAEAKFRLVIEAAPSGMLMIDHQGSIILANRLLTQQFGYGQEELLGQPIEVLVPARFRDQHPAHRTAFFQTSTPRQMGSGRDLYGLRKDGSEFPVEIGLNPVTTDEGTFVLASIIDITKRKRHEEQQKRLSNRLLLATQSANIGIWEWNIGQNELTWDSQMYTLYGLPPDSKQVPYATWVNALHAEDREAAEASLQKALRGEQDFNTEFRVIWPDKSVHYIKGAALVDRNSKGEAIRMIGVNWDITKERNAEEVLQIHMNELKRSNKELEDFASIASHDLQEPLRKIQAFGDRLKGKWAETLGPQGLDYLERMQHAAGRMQTLIADLLSFSRITSKANPFVQVNLAKVANEVVSDLEVRITQVGGKVELGDLPIIEADPTQMRQLFQNLIGNAMKFHKKDEPPLVNIQSQYVNGNHASASQDRWICLTVSDNGIGFDEKYVEKIFGIFQRLHSHSEYEGTGVGLAICQKIAARHNGRIDAKSALGKGTSFSITLPTVQGKDNKLS